MLISFESRLKQLKYYQENDMLEEQMPVKDTLVVINGAFDFKRTDGFIQFMELALGNIINAYGKQDEKWQEYIDRICGMAEKLQDSNTRFTGSTEEEFREYCEKLSGIMENGAGNRLGIPVLATIEVNDIIPVLEKNIEVGNTLGFYYKWSENPVKGLMDDLMNQLSRLKFEKKHYPQAVSYFLIDSGYHENVHDALNMILQAAVYMINCSSTKRREAYIFDMQEMDSRLQCVRSIMERTRFLV